MSLLRHRLKRQGAAVLASSLLASFAMLGATSPAQAAVEPQPNPSLSDKCGLDIGIVLDLSNSLSDEDIANSKSAAKAVANGLSGTPSRVSVNTFATFGPDGTNEPIPSTSVAASESVDSLNQSIEDIRRVPSNSGGTNWDRGLGQLEGSQHDLVLFVTDGKPTAYGVPGSDSGNNDRGTATDQIDIDKAVESANSLKSQGSKVVGLGVGSEINEDNIKLVSGQTVDDDYYVVSDYSELAKQLREIATKNCLGSLNVTKLIDPGVGGHGDKTDKYRGEGWTISSANSIDGVDKVTDADGTVSFKLKTPTDGVQATEEQQEGYRLQQQSDSNAVCTVDGKEVGTKNITNGFELTETVASDDIVACQIVNEQIPGGLRWKKVDEDGKALAGAEFTLTGPDGEDFLVSDNGDLDADDVDGQFEVTDLAWGEYTLKETTAPAGYELSDQSQTVTINGEELERSFSDIVNKKDITIGADPDADNDASTDPDADDSASADPAAEKDSSADPKGTDDASADPSAEKDSSADPKGTDDASTDPGAEKDSSVDPKGSDDASADPDADDSKTDDANSAASSDTDSNAGRNSSSTSNSNASAAADSASADRSASGDNGSSSGNGNGHLPRTGAAGGLTFGIVGALLMVAGAIAVIASRRPKSRH